MATKINFMPPNNLGILIVYCPECDSQMDIVTYCGAMQKGNYYRCKDCEFVTKQYKRSYKKFRHEYIKK